MTSETPFIKQQGEPPQITYSTIQANQRSDPPQSHRYEFGAAGVRAGGRYTLGVNVDDSVNPVFLILSCCWIFAGTLVCTGIVAVLFGAVPIAVLVVGALHLDDCDLDDRIPIWMVVFGSVSVAYTLVNILKSIFCSPKEETKREPTYGYMYVQDYSMCASIKRALNKFTRIIETLFNLFLFVWLIIGSVWVLSKYSDWNDAGRPNCNGLPDDSDKCCHEGMFLFAFIFIVVSWSILFLVICCVCSCIFLVRMLSNAPGSE